jgi:lipoprotein-anchoring transpeptidase ErfK/SrfK
MHDTTTVTTIAESSDRIGIGVRLAAVSTAALLLLGACSTPERSEIADPPSTAGAPTSTSPAPGDEAPPAPPSTSEADESNAPVAPTRAVSQVAVLTVVDGPGSTTVVAELDDRTSFGSARILLVDRIADGWVRVKLPVRPNGSTGWVRSDEVRLETLDRQVTVDLAARELTVWVDGAVDRVIEVAIGSTVNPTPTGSFYVVDKLDTANAGGAYGPYALGLSAHSDTLSEFGGGDGQIGIHGTNDPSSLGHAVSHGCVRLPNDAITHLATELPLGTPVVIS